MPQYRPEPERFFEKVEKVPGGCWQWTAGIANTGYGMFHLGRTRKLVGAHRWSYQYHKGEIPPGMAVDHICRNRSCVNPKHLRLATQGENMQNQGINPLNVTGHRGVYFCSRTGRYGAQIVIEGKKKFLGRYPTADEAGEVARLARLQHYTHNVDDRL